MKTGTPEFRGGWQESNPTPLQLHDEQGLPGTSLEAFLLEDWPMAGLIHSRLNVRFSQSATFLSSRQQTVAILCGSLGRETVVAAS